MKLIALLLNLLYYFYRGIQCDKTHNFVHGKVFEAEHEIYRFRHGWYIDATSVKNTLLMWNFHRL